MAADAQPKARFVGAYFNPDEYEALTLLMKKLDEANGIGRKISMSETIRRAVLKCANEQ